MKLGSTGMATSHWCAIVALWFAPGTKESHGTAQSARTYSFQSRILPTGYKATVHLSAPCVWAGECVSLPARSAVFSTVNTFLKP